MIELLNIDCMKHMAGCGDNTFDLAIVDPQYGIGQDLLRNGPTRSKLAKAGEHRMFDNTEPPPPEYFVELKRISKNQIIWGANHFCDRFDANGPRWIFWDKHTGGNVFSDGELAYTSFPGALRKFDYPWNGMIQGYHGDKRLNEVRIHPTQKPIALYAWLLEMFARQGDLILDTHLGSGSSAIAAHRLGYDFVGCEIDEFFYSAAQARLASETQQETMKFENT